MARTSRVARPDVSGRLAGDSSAGALQALSRLTALDGINLDAHVGAAVDAIALCLEADDDASAGAPTPRGAGAGAPTAPPAFPRPPPPTTA